MGKDGLKSEFEHYAEKVLAPYDVPGFWVDMAQKGEQIYGNGFGYRDREETLSLSADTVFGIGSNTKAFTAVAILQLQEQGKLSVHDCVNQYLPAFKVPNDENTEAITIHHLLSHSSGLPPLPTLIGAVKKSMAEDPPFADGDEQQQPNPLDDIPAIDTYAELMEAIATAKVEMLGEPGSEFSYSNDGFALLGAIIGEVSGMRYEQYVTEHILAPAGMHHSGFHIHDIVGHDDIATLYDVGAKDGKPVVFRSNHHWDAPVMRAAGFLKSTANDMQKFMQIILNDGKVGNAQLLSSASVEAMITPHIQIEPGTYYGYGLMIVPDFFGYKLIHHGGDVKGVSAQMNMLPEQGVSGVALANLAGVPSTKLLFAAFATYLGQAVDASIINAGVVDVVPERLAECAGTFASAEGMACECQVKDDGKLYMAVSGMPADVLKPIGKDLFTFQMRGDDFLVRFVRDEKGNVCRLAFAFRQMAKVDSEKLS